MSYKIAINGFGRIGRVALRILEERRLLGAHAQVVAINDLAQLDELEYLFKYDSVHGRFKGDVSREDGYLNVNGQKIKALAIREPAELPWRELGVDVVLESTGLFLSRDKAQKHIDAGAKKVLLSAPAKDSPDATICYGVNSSDYRPDMKIISTASCTTNCIAPVAKVLHEQFVIKKASVTTIHSYTNDQHILDKAHKDKRRSRAAAVSMIPTTTGAAKAISLVMPELEGRFQGMAIRVPTPNVSLIDMVCHVEKNTNVAEINNALKQASETTLKGILGYCDDPVVSVDMLGTNCSSIVDSLCTEVIDGDLIKVLSWYDNEWGFANRAVDLLQLLCTNGEK
ncbi:MAG: type I glyceraldehyde-3-phosphate dehydrogenase [Myxococcales bacterium]|nr:type I glyceraldehyde-3-phosphate dehydrogenase [Myxococcales bacterium]USN50605.1 MAG: type I glyceraldehyde-3-phosphate dehydrogenase [Myxococcales bacterium]